MLINFTPKRRLRQRGEHPGGAPRATCQHRANSTASMLIHDAAAATLAFLIADLGVFSEQTLLCRSI
ncbi:MAG: hypothetical protein JWP06_1188 [Candidatus Saccharibacteria bacterium]|nr:hypothetical protein [Candidatus Saccharibacteria bacterium]